MGVAVGTLVGVAVGVMVGVGVAEGPGVAVGVTVGVGPGVMVGVNVAVGVKVGVAVGVFVGNGQTQSVSPVQRGFTQRYPPATFSQLKVIPPAAAQSLSEVHASQHTCGPISKLL